MSLKDSLEKINEECAEKIVELQRKELDLIVNHELEELASIEVGIDRIIKIIKKNNDLIKELTPGPININPLRGNDDFFKAPDWSRNPIGDVTISPVKKAPDWSRNPIGDVTISPVKSEPTSASPFTREFKYTTVTNGSGNIKEPDWSNTHSESGNISATSASPLNQDEFISVCDDASKEAVNRIFEKNALRFEGPGENTSEQNLSDIERAVHMCPL